jgi:hypothetical protein
MRSLCGFIGSNKRVNQDGLMNKGVVEAHTSLLHLTLSINFSAFALAATFSRPMTTISAAFAVKRMVIDFPQKGFS